MYKLSLNNDILKDMKRLFRVSRIFGLSPVSIVKSSINAEETVETKLSRNVGGILCSVIVFCAMATGLILSVVDCISNDISDAGVLVNLIVSQPMLYLSAGVSVATHCIVNRNKIAELLQQLSSINKAIIEKQRRYFTDVRQREACSGVKVLMTVFISQIIFLWIDIILRASNYNMDIRIVTVWVATWVNVLIMIQFCKFVGCIKYTLRELTRTMSVNTYGNTVSCAVKRGFKSRQQFGQSSESCTAVHIDMIKEIAPFNKDLRHSTPEEALSVNRITFFRHVYNDVYDAHSLVNSIYGIPILLGFIINVTFSIINVYCVLKDPPTTSSFKPRKIMFQLFAFISCITIVLYETVSCHLVTVQSSKLRDKIQKLLLINSLHSDSVSQLKLFSDQISKNCINFQASCLFTIDMSLFCAYVANTITYTIVLVQFK
jgi:hypothetical protein